MTDKEVYALPVTIDIETVGKAYGLSRSRAYALAQEDKLPIPVIRLGRRLRARKADLLADLGLARDVQEAS